MIVVRVQINPNNYPFDHRFDQVLLQAMKDQGVNISRTRLQKIIHAGGVKNDSDFTFTSKDLSSKIVENMSLKIIVPDQDSDNIEAVNIDLDIVYEDDHLLVINKPAGLITHPGAGNYNNTLVNGLLYHYSQDNLSLINGRLRAGIVHRLDKDTSGLIVVAKTDIAHRGLSEQFADRKVKKIYKALVWRRIIPVSDTINLNIDRHKHNRLKMKICPYDVGRSAITHYKMIQSFGQYASLLEVQLETGRTHQIRVHLSYKKHTIIGDNLYGHSQFKILRNFDDEKRQLIYNFPRQALHAESLEFTHPVTQETLKFSCELPQDIKQLINYFS